VLQRGAPSLAFAINSLLIAHSMRADLLADYAVLMALGAVGKVVADFGLDRYVPEQVVDAPTDQSTTFDATLIRACTGIFVGAAVGVLGSLLTRSADASFIQASAVLLQGPTLVALGVAIARKQVHRLVVPAAASLGCSVVAGVVGANSASLPTIVFGSAAGSLVESALAWRAIRPRFRGVRLDPQRLLHRLRHSAHFASQSALATAYARVPLFLLSPYDQFQTAAFSIGYAPFGAMARLPSSLALVSFPGLVRAVRARGSSPGIAALCRQYLGASVPFLVAASVTAWLAPAVVVALYGQQYVIAGNVYRWLVLAAAIGIVSNFSLLVLFAAGRLGTVVVFSVGSLLCLVAIGRWLAPSGAEGEAVAFVLAELLAAVTFSVLAARAVGSRE
jgi:O-antigen/teichoic acid export membrane protein